MRISLDSGFFLSQVTMQDVPALVQYLSNEKIYRNTLRIPFPYGRNDAGWFVQHVEERRQQYGRLTNWAIRTPEVQLIGGISLHVAYGIHSHKDEIGYWLGEPFWGRGLGTETVGAIAGLALGTLGLLRLEANIFDFNAASSRILEKNGFTYEGLLRNYYLKDGKPIHAMMYSKIRE